MSAADKPTADDIEVIEPQQGAAAGHGLNISPQAAAMLMQATGGNPALMQMMQAKLDELIGSSSGFIESLPAKVQRRIQYLEALQEKHDELVDSFEEELAALEEKYRKQYEPLYEKRKLIVTGAEEPPAAPEGEEPAAPAEAEEGEEVPAGVPQFWLNVLRNCEDIAEQITEKDEEVLEHLIDISVQELGTGPEAEAKPEEEDEEDEECGFKLIFTFEPNAFFSETVLTKTYHMAPGQDDMLQEVEATAPTWAAGKNPTVKLMKKKVKKGAKPGAKPQTKLEPVDSFFNFFSPPEVPDDGADMDEEEMAELQDALERDYEVGNTIKEDLIPRAVAWYTGAAVQGDDEDDDEFEDEDEEDDEDEDDDEDDDDDDDDDAPIKPKGASQKRQTGGAPADAKEPECKQQ